MIVPVIVKIDHENQAKEYSLSGMDAITSVVGKTYSLQATMLDLETGDFRTYAFKSVQSGEPDDVSLYLNRGQVDGQLRALRAGLDRWLGGELDEVSEFERVKNFVRGASRKELGAVMGVCLGQLDQRGGADIVTLLRELTAMVERMVDGIASEANDR